MAYDEERVVTTREEVATTGRPGYVDPYGRPAAAATVSESAIVRRRSPLRTVERLIVFLFGLIQGLLLIRIVLLLIAAREGNPLVATIYNISDIFVAPFRGILGRNEIAAGRSELDVAAIVAIIGWTIIELIILGLLRVFRRDPY